MQAREETKICTWCGKEKYLSDFYSRMLHSKNRGDYIYHHPECKQCTKDNAFKWTKENPVKRAEHQRKANETPRKKEQMKKLSKASRDDGRYREWQRANKDKIDSYRENRQQNKKHEIKMKEWEDCKEYFNNECAYCGLHISEHFNRYAGEMKWTDFHKEHVEHEGSNDITNCVPSCKSCNSSKFTFTLEEWYTSENDNYFEERLLKIYQWLKIDVYKYKIE